MTRRGPRMALGKVRRKRVCYPPLVRLVVLSFNRNFYFIFCDLNV